MGERSVLSELALALLAGVATWAGVRLAQTLEDPYSEPRLALTSLQTRLRGGDS